MRFSRRATARSLPKRRDPEPPPEVDGRALTRPALEPFSEVIRASGLYKQLREQFDPKGWEMLEKTTGKLV
jgi:hypothetical protein